MKLNWAERWAVNNPWRIAQQRLEIRFLREVSALPPGCKVLEVGCGRGAGAELILSAFRPSILHASDLDAEMIGLAKKFLSPANRQNIFMYVADVLKLPYRDSVMDAVFVFGVLHHVPDWRAALREIARVLKAGGLFMFEELYPTLYQNFITRHILLHPRENRFFSSHLKSAMQEARLPVKRALELKKLGILGISVKEG